MSRSVEPENTDESITYNIDTHSVDEAIEVSVTPVGSSRNCCNSTFDGDLKEFMRRHNDENWEKSTNGFNEEEKAVVFTGNESNHKQHDYIKYLETIDSDITSEYVEVNNSK